MPKRTRRRRSQSISLSRLLIVIALLVAGYYLLLWYNGGKLSDVLTLPTSGPAAGAPTAPPAQPAPGGQAWYQLYFTTPRYPDKAAYHTGGIDTELVALLDTATTSIDLADYDFDLENVASALARAAGRGVRVRMVTDSDTLTRGQSQETLAPRTGADDEASNTLALSASSDTPQIAKAIGIVQSAGITIVGDNRPAIMHDKFVVVDAATVWTGSWNFTTGDTYRLNNNAIEIKSPELAHNYTVEFEKMFVEQTFGPHKSNGGTEPVLNIGGAHVENYFAPKDPIAQHIVDRINQAKTSIHFMAFSFTDDDIGSAMRARAAAGVEVRGVFETTGSETQYSEYGKLRKAKLDVLQDGNPYVMHHKVIIIDGRTVIFGSYNFTKSASTDNDENLLIVDDPALAAAFEAEFGRVHDQALNPPKKK